MTLFDIKNMEVAIGRISKSNTLSTGDAYRFMKFYKKYAEELKIVEDFRQKLVLRYGVEDPATKTIVVSPENLPKFQVDFMEFLMNESELKLEETEKFSLSLIEHLRFTPEELVALDPILKEM